MSATAEKQTMEFQAEVKQLLHLMIHSLYSNKEIFFRELISNASDAADKLRFEALSDDSLYDGDGDLKIQVDVDKQARTITISDNGIGMSREELIENIGTIANSGTRKFLDSLTGEQASDAHLIGQFGVGFYSSFIVADKVELITRRAGSDKACHWESTGEGDFDLADAEKASRGTEVILHLREGEDEFLETFRLHNIIHKYSDHIQIPIVMKPNDDSDTYEIVNKASALWTRQRKEISEDEYNEFYKHVAHDFEDPLAHLHSRVEGNIEYTSLLFVPGRAPFDLWDRERAHGIKLYVRRVFIMEDSEKLMPLYLRFVRGVIDTNDLPLNISRETLQHNKVMESIRAGSVKKILGLLEDMAKNEKDKYAVFWKEFGCVMKEGPTEDFANKERIAGLLRFSTTLTDSDVQDVSLDDYVSRMKEGQEKIYYITADSFAAARNSPHLEVFRKNAIEALILSERVDEWLISALTDYAGKALQSVARGDLELGELEDASDKEVLEKAEKDAGDIIRRIQEALGDSVKDVRTTHRLTDSPACLIADENDMGANMQRILQAVGQDVPTSKPILEINPIHPLVDILMKETNNDRFADLSSILYEQALLSEGGQLDDPASFVHKLNNLITDLAS
ncbi:MAG: molecular chaperone HtpG [Gammaproteobacteria bacterium]|nr:MAG: molecular chaperone HtpG [Gammaproteobacteria bacterium]